MAKCKPFLKWAGGKTQLLPEIEKALPEYITEGEPFTYIEPFVGSGAVLFWILRTFPNARQVVINDINTELMSTYQVVQQYPQELINSLRTIQEQYYSISKEEDRKTFFLTQRARFNAREFDNIELATLMIFLNRTCFNGLYRVNKSGAFNVPFGKYKNPRILDEETLLANSEALQNVIILNGDFEQTLEYAQDNTLFYFDPPYKPLSKTSSFNTYAADAFNDDEQIRLRDFCNTIDTQGYNWILSNSDVRGTNPDDTFFDVIFEQYNINRVRAKRAINANPEKRGELSELLISNFETETLV